MPKKTHHRSKYHRKSWSFVIAFVVVFAAIGSYLLLTSHAAGSPMQLQLALNRNYCLDNFENAAVSKNPIVIWGCSSTDSAQQWTLENVSGGFLIEDAKGICVDDTGDGVSTASGDPVNVQTYACSASDHAQVWKWTGSSSEELENAYNDGCINDPSSSASDGTQLVVNPCSSVSANAEWYAVSASSSQPTPSVSIAAPSNGATVSGTSVTFSANASVSSGSISNLTITVAGTTLAACANTTTCSGSWNSTGVGNGSYAVQAIATASGGGTAQTSETINVSNASTPPAQNSTPPSSSNSSSNQGSSSSATSGINDSYYNQNDNLDVDSSGNSDGSISLGSSSSGNSSSDLPVSQSPTGTLDNGDTSGAPSSDSAPSVYDILPTKITTNSIVLSWGSADATAYDIKYGTNRNHLTVTHVLKTTSMAPTYLLTDLPSNTMIYISITPTSGGTSGTTGSASIKTLKPPSPIGLIIVAIVTLGVVGVAVILVKRMMRPKSADIPSVQIEHLETYPQEDSATQAARVNWWLPDEQRQAIASQQPPPIQQQKPVDDYPDMYEQGRKRLEEEEEKQRRFYGE